MKTLQCENNPILKFSEMVNCEKQKNKDSKALFVWRESDPSIPA